MCTCVCGCTHLHVYTRRDQKRILNIFLYCCPPDFLENKCLMNLTTLILIGRSPQQIPRIPLFSNPCLLPQTRTGTQDHTLLSLVDVRDSNSWPHTYLPGSLIP